MKKFSLLNLLMVSLFANAQTAVYHPFPDSNAIWNIHGQGCCNFDCGITNPGITDSYFSTFLFGDTIINSVSYHKIYESGTVHEHCLYGNTVNNRWSFHNVYVCSIRQDTIAKKVFKFFNQEALIFDYNWIVGDTVPYENCAVINSIDSMLIGSNYRKRFNLSTSPTYSIIDGIGSTSGLLEPLCPFEYFATLLCFAQNGQTLYPDTISVCEIISYVNEIQNKFTVSVFPNPFHSSALLNVNSEFQNAELKIYNLMGQQIRKQTVINTSATITRDELSNGIYFFQATNQQGQVLTGKFIIE